LNAAGQTVVTLMTQAKKKGGRKRGGREASWRQHLGRRVMRRGAYASQKRIKKGGKGGGGASPFSILRMSALHADLAETDKGREGKKKKKGGKVNT